MRTDTLIVGGGLAGLSLASQLADAGQSFLLAEARTRFGGRILTRTHGSGYFDLGPAWYWPGQPRIGRLVAQLGLRRFDQHADGELVYENEHGQLQRGLGYGTSPISHRLEGGLGALIAALHERLPEGTAHSAAEIVTLRQRDGGIIATTQGGQQFTAKRVVLALPPRIAARLSFDPALPDEAVRAMERVATWMAGQAKAVMIYDRPFWRDAGLSGDAMSRIGPMAEIHDASPAIGGPYALFGFIGVPPERRRNEQILQQGIKAQMVRMFGPQASEPEALYIKDWALDSCTSTMLDLEPVYAHPQYGMAAALNNLWDGRILFGGTETAPQFGGYLEGALEAAEIASGHIQALQNQEA